MTPTRKQKTSFTVRLSVGQAQLLHRVVDRCYADSYSEKDESVYNARHREMLDTLLKKIEAGLESIERN
jgi:hypothetical protein